MKCGLLHLNYFEIGCDILNFSVCDSLFFSFEALHSFFILFKGLFLIVIGHSLSPYKINLCKFVMRAVKLMVLCVTMKFFKNKLVPR